MKHKAFSLLALAAAGVLGASAASAQVSLTFGGINPPGAPVTQASKRFAELVNERTEGRVHVDFYEGSQLGSGPAQIEAMSAGAQDGYISSGSNASNLVKEFGVVDIPFVFQSQDHFLKFMESDLAKGLKDELRDDFNVRILATNWFRLPRVFMTKGACVETPEDIAGKRVRSPNLPMFIAGWEAVGTVPVTISYGETYMGLSQGVADMAESAGEQVYSSKFYEVLPYVTDAQMMYPQNSVYIAESSFQQLSDEDKEIVTKAAEDAGDYFVSLVEEQTAPNRETMEAEGVTFCDMSAETREAFAAKVAESVPSFEEEGLLPEGWWDQIQAMK
ncbi:TRAP transporter substrate-binding protein [Salipiger sp. PrR002]|uniref:TRAP transporter substrate-binding protein n=1 Tax=Salipiger sp. PrR002 TaxID=2706489 RepID=UPI0013BD3B67|nr:TRAP transporter substrate-binding protein [Salipiger sp. PrR002]NDW01530.1 TRAP transporter substrate-binding protein [Salipiger sp. PrR002]NDW58235.1 TRAP transporter substrate-binding protein [Salipiger sp. PrR004]